MGKKKILFVYQDMVIGGSTTSLLNLLYILDRKKYDIDLLLYRNEGALLEYIPEDVHLLPQACIKSTGGRLMSKAKKFLLALFKGYIIRGYWEELKHNKRFGWSLQVAAEAIADLFSRSCADTEYDIAVGYLENWSDKYVAGEKVSAKRKIGWIHMNYLTSRFYIPKLDAKCFSALDTVVSVSKRCEVAHKTLFNLKDSRYLPNILSSRVVEKRSIRELDKSDNYYKIWCEKKDIIKIITVCRLQNNEKGIDRAVKAAYELKKRGLKFLWYVIGDGPDANVLKRMVSEHGVDDCLYMIGARINPYPYIKMADLFVLPSRTEGKPMVITESMILKVPAVVTEYASSSEQIRNGIDGVIVENNDTSLAEPLARLIENPEEIIKLKNNICDTLGNENDIKLYDELFLK